jgi:predicted neuraminidase
MQRASICVTATVGIVLLAVSVLVCGCAAAAPPDVLPGVGLHPADLQPFAGAEPVRRNTPIFMTIPGKVGSHAPTITAFGDGELLAAWYSYEEGGELNGAAIYMARRLAGASEWTEPRLHVDRPEADGNPVLYGEGGAVWMFQAVVPGTGWRTAHIEVQRSSDRGVTWSPPEPIAGPLGANVRYPPVRIAIKQSPSGSEGHPTSGDLLLPAYDDLLGRCLFYVSSDGVQWQQRSTLATPLPYRVLQPSIALLEDGRLLAVMRNSERGWLWASYSDDDGRTWTTPADSGFANPASPAALLRLASGNLALVFNDSNEVRRPLSIALSGDDGLTWQAAHVLVDGPGEYAYPSAVQTPDGVIHIVYSHDREYIGHIEVNEEGIEGLRD